MCEREREIQRKIYRDIAIEREREVGYQGLVVQGEERQDGEKERSHVVDPRKNMEHAL